jgi:hypothetical protein
VDSRRDYCSSELSLLAIAEAVEAVEAAEQSRAEQTITSGRTTVLFNLASCQNSEGNTTIPYSTVLYCTVLCSAGCCHPTAPF